MVEQKCLIYWILLSSVLHLAILAWAPVPDNDVPPRPIFLAVDMVAHPQVGAGGSPASGNEKTNFAHPPFVPRLIAESTSDREPEKRIPPDHPVPADPDELNRTGKMPAEPSTLETTPPLSDENNDSPNETEVAATVRGGKSTTESGFPNSAPGSRASVASPLAYGTNPPPPYPVSARRRGWEGEVMLRIDVSADGRVRKVAVAKSTGFPVLDEAAQNAVYRWRFQPARLDGRPVPGQVMVPVRFDLRKAD